MGLRTSFSILSCLRFSLPLLSHLTSPITIHIFTFRGGIVPTSTIRITPGLRFMLWSWSSCSCSWGEGLTGFLSTFYCLVWFVEMWYDFGIKAENIQETSSVQPATKSIKFITLPLLVELQYQRERHWCSHFCCQWSQLFLLGFDPTRLHGPHWPDELHWLHLPHCAAGLASVVWKIMHISAAKVRIKIINFIFLWYFLFEISQRSDSNENVQWKQLLHP